MKSEVKKLPKSQVEISVELAWAELAPYLEKAAEKVSKEAKIDGFRPGKAPYSIVKQKFGEAAILNEAADDILSKTYFQVLKENEIMAIGQPQIRILKSAPENDFSYVATVAILPKVKVGDLAKVSVAKAKAEVKPEQVEKVIEDIRKMRAKQVVVERAAKKGDVLELDFDIFLDKVPIENGQYKKFPVSLGEGKFIPGFEEQVEGMKAGDEKEFELEFPKDYFEKKLAGKKCEFKAKCLAVYEVEMPEVSDGFAKEISGGQFGTVDAMKKNIEENLLKEEEAKADQKAEVEMFDKLVEASEFDELPETLLHNEMHRMVHELEDSVTRQGLNFEDYLKSIKKTHDDLEKDFRPQAEKRVKTSILCREIYQEQKMDVTEDEVGVEIEEMMKNYPANPEVRKQLEAETYKDYLRNVIGNRKVVDYLKEKTVK